MNDVYPPGVSGFEPQIAGTPELPPPEHARKPMPTMDPTLRLAAKLDRLMAEMSPWARQWALAYLMAKYPPARADSPNCNMPPI